MAAGDKIIQLHKAGEPSEKWFPNSYSKCITVDGYTYSYDETASNIVDSDTLNSAFNKIDSRIVKNTNQFNSLSTTVGSLTSTVGNKQTKLKAGNNITLASTPDAQGFIEISATGGGGGGDVTADSVTTLGRLVKFTGTKQVGDSCITESNGKIGVGTSSIESDIKLQVNGNFYAQGSVTCLQSSSDKRLKTDIKPFNGLDIIGGMDFVQFKWNDKAVELNGDYFNTHTINYGVIAQDVDGMVDGLVFDMEKGYKGVKYEKLIPIMAQAIKELKSEIDELKQQLNR